MGMLSEIAVNSAIQTVAGEIKKELENAPEGSEVQTALKRLGRSVMSHLEFCTDDWVDEYQKLFT